MGNRLITIVGVVLILIGAFWALQGFGAIGGNFMTGNNAFKIIGPVLAIIGLLVTVIGVRRARSA